MSTNVGGIPEVLPEEMITLTEPSLFFNWWIFSLLFFHVVLAVGRVVEGLSDAIIKGVTHNPMLTFICSFLLKFF